MSNKVIEKLAKELNLPKGDRFTQDWEYEVADYGKTGVFLEYYKNNKLNADEKQTLMRLILESYNDYVGESGYKDNYSNELRDILQKESTLYHDIIEDWACVGEDWEDCFAITPLIREIRKVIRSGTV